MSTLLLQATLLPSLAAISYLLTGWYRRYAISNGVMDTANARSSHSGSTPRGGGLSIVATTLAMLAVSTATNWLPLPLCLAALASGSLVAFIGLIDDHRPLPSHTRLFVHISACALALFILMPLPTLRVFSLELSLNNPIGFITTTLALTWLINLYNFMDGIDGIASMEAISVLLGASFILHWHQDPLSSPILILIAPVVGFLIWNWAPAKIFMGDSCSGFLGLIIGLIALFSHQTTSLNLWCWSILLGVFIVDASWTLCVRICTQQHWLKAHRSHCYQILSRRYSHSAVTLGITAINLLWLLPLALFASTNPELGPIITTIALSPLVAACAHQKAGQRN